MKVKVKFKTGTTRYEYDAKIIECMAWGKRGEMFWFNKASDNVNEMLMSDKIVCIPTENVLYVEDLEDE
jgi:hypothetical protein